MRNLQLHILLILLAISLMGCDDGKKKPEPKAKNSTNTATNSSTATCPAGGCSAATDKSNQDTKKETSNPTSNPDESKTDPNNKKTPTVENNPGKKEQPITDPAATPDPAKPATAPATVNPSAACTLAKQVWYLDFTETDAEKKSSKDSLQVKFAFNEGETEENDSLRPFKNLDTKPELKLKPTGAHETIYGEWKIDKASILEKGEEKPVSMGVFINAYEKANPEDKLRYKPSSFSFNFTSSIVWGADSEKQTVGTEVKSAIIIEQQFKLESEDSYKYCTLIGTFTLAENSGPDQSDKLTITPIDQIVSDTAIKFSTPGKQQWPSFNDLKNKFLGN